MLYHSCNNEKDRILTSIIHSLDVIDGGIKALEKMLKDSRRPLPFALLDAEAAIEKIVVDYQVAEEVIREGYAKGYLTKKQIQVLHQELRRSVRHLIDISTYSALLAHKVQEKLGTGHASSTGSP